MTVKTDLSLDSTSTCSSMVSFMSGLLRERGSQMDLGPNQPMLIAIVNDNAKQRISTLNRCQSLVTMQHSRSGRQISRWSTNYDQNDSDPSLLMNLSPPRRPAPAEGSIPTAYIPPRATSDTMLLRIPQRSRDAPRTTTMMIPSHNTNSSGLSNAKWGNPLPPANQQQQQKQPNSGGNMMYSTEGTLKPKPNMFLDKLSTLSLSAAATTAAACPLNQGPIQLHPASVAAVSPPSVLLSSLSDHNNHKHDAHSAIKNQLLLQSEPSSINTTPTRTSVDHSGAPVKPTRRHSMEKIRHGCTGEMLRNSDQEEDAAAAAYGSMAASFADLKSTQRQHHHRIYTRDSTAALTMPLPHLSASSSHSRSHSSHSSSRSSHSSSRSGVASTTSTQSSPSTSSRKSRRRYQTTPTRRRASRSPPQARSSGAARSPVRSTHGRSGTASTAPRRYQDPSVRGVNPPVQ